MKIVPLLLLGGAAYLFLQKDAPITSSNAQAFSQAAKSDAGFLASGNYENERDIAAAIMGANDAASALAAVQNIVAAPPPMTTDQLSNPEQNPNYGKTFASPYDMARIAYLDTPAYAPAKIPILVTQSAYDAKARAIAGLQAKVAGSRGERQAYYQKILDSELREFEMMQVA